MSQPWASPSASSSVISLAALPASYLAIMCASWRSWSEGSLSAGGPPGSRPPCNTVLQAVHQPCQQPALQLVHSMSVLKLAFEYKCIRRDALMLSIPCISSAAAVDFSLKVKSICPWCSSSCLPNLLWSQRQPTTDLTKQVCTVWRHARGGDCVRD